MNRGAWVAGVGMLAVLASVRPSAGQALVVTPRTFTFAEPPNEMVLENGQKLGPVTVVYETYGHLAADGRNGVLILHGMGGTAHAAGRHTANPEERPGWWDALIGPGRPFDTDRFYVVSPQALAGGHRDRKPGTGTTGPHSTDPRTGRPYGMRFPTFSIRDMVRVHKALLDHLGVKHLVVVSGVSMGGYQALELICTFPDFADGAIPVVARGRSPAQHALDHFIRRMSIMNDANWQDGDYYDTGRYPTRGQALASMASSRSYNNAPSFNDDKQADVPGASPYDKVTNNFAFEGQLWANALENAERNIDANDYLYQSRALANQNLGWKRGDYSRGYRANLADALKLTSAAVLMMPSKTDDSVRPSYGQEIVDIMRTLGKRAEIHVIDSERGHGGSSEFSQMIPPMKRFIDSLPGGAGVRPARQP
ncbi:MAG: alpha/beta fold hydrolase family protein [Vicinamibacterales bacterium]